MQHCRFCFFSLLYIPTRGSHKAAGLMTKKATSVTSQGVLAIHFLGCLPSHGMMPSSNFQTFPAQPFGSRPSTTAVARRFLNTGRTTPGTSCRTASRSSNESVSRASLISPCIVWCLSSSGDSRLKPPLFQPTSLANYQPDSTVEFPIPVGTLQWRSRPRTRHTPCHPTQERHKVTQELVGWLDPERCHVKVGGTCSPLGSSGSSLGCHAVTKCSEVLSCGFVLYCMYCIAIHQWSATDCTV